MHLGHHQDQVALLILLFSLGCGRIAPPVTDPPPSGPPAGTVLAITDLRGTLKPCGCSPDLQRGGVDRIAEHITRARKDTPAALVLHAGNLLVDDEGVPAARRAQIALRTKTLGRALGLMGLSAATLGEYDVAQGREWLAKALADVPVPIVATNVIGDWWAGFSRKTLLLRAGTLRVGVIGLLPPGIGVTDPASAARKNAGALRAEGADVVVVLSSLGLRGARRLLREPIGADIVIAGGQDLKAVVEPETEPLSGALLVQTHVQGSQVGRLEAKVDGVPKFAWRLTPIDWTLPQHPAVLALMVDYDKQLEAVNLAAAGTLPPLEPGQAGYVGVGKCLECHEKAKPFWEADRHQRAWETLVKDGKTFDLECVSCHTTGYGKPGGSILGALRGLEDVQCEQCHGPGSLHAESGDTAAIRRSPTAAVCVECHSEKHSTHFDYDLYKAKLIVPGHGK